MATQPGLDLFIDADRAVITISRDFDEGVKRDEWSQTVIDHFGERPGLQAVVVDLGKCPIISSTVIAGLVHLYDHYRERCSQGVILRHCTKHVEKILTMMHLRQLFSFEQPLERN